jgi:hypothetical protein
MSDHLRFALYGIPIGGLFAGSTEVKSAEQAAMWGGTPGVAFDPCYQLECDGIANVYRVALNRNIEALAWAIGTYSYSTEDINGVPPGP